MGQFGVLVDHVAVCPVGGHPHNGFFVHVALAHVHAAVTQAGQQILVVLGMGLRAREVDLVSSAPLRVQTGFACV